MTGMSFKDQTAGLKEQFENAQSQEGSDAGTQLPPLVFGKHLAPSALEDKWAGHPPAGLLA